MPKIGPMELIIILLIVVMIFGVGKLPQAAGSLGKAMKEFRKESSRTDDDAVADDEEVVVVKKKRATTTTAAARKAKVAKVKEIED
jgi:sec-independent protein translocase protein TatA